MAAATDPMVFNADVLERLNRLSLTRSFTPQVDIDWSAVTTDDEYPRESAFDCRQRKPGLVTQPLRFENLGDSEFGERCCLGLEALRGGWFSAWVGCGD